MSVVPVRPVWLVSHAALAAAWDYSAARLRAMADRLSAAALDPRILTVAIAGSLARRDASEQSDCDLIVILDNATSSDSAASQAVWDELWQALAPLGLRPPKATGIYARPVTERELFDDVPPGRVAESLHTFGIRIQMLLEGQPVYGAAEFGRLLDRAVARYAAEFVAVDPQKEWTYLLNDVGRYFRSLAVAYQWEQRDRPAVWRLRNLKAAHSRQILWAGMIWLLGECSREQHDKIAWLRSRLSLTPWERLAHVYALYDDSGIETILRCGNRFVAALTDPATRTTLAHDDAPDHPLACERNLLYQELQANAAILRAELLRFLLARRGEWSDRFLEDLIL